MKLGPFGLPGYYVGDCLDLLRQLPDGSVNCCVTSPPYWGLRDYGIDPSVWGGRPGCQHQWGDEQRLHKGGPHGAGVMVGGSRSVVEAQAAVKDIRAGQFCETCDGWLGVLGLEPDYRMYVEHMVEVFREVRRVLRDDGTVWLNLGDCYATGAGAVGDCPGGGDQGERWRGYRGERLPNGRGDQAPEGRVKTRATRDGTHAGKHTAMAAIGPMTQPNRMPQPRLKPKDLVGIPWRVSFALQEGGWYLRSDIIWHKPNPMPESVKDRPTKAHEYLFLLAKSESYHYDAAAIAEDAVSTLPAGNGFAGRQGGSERVGPQSGCAGTAEPWSPKVRLRDSANDSHVPGTHNHSGIHRAGTEMEPAKRNKRSVWTIGTEPTHDAHFATFPRKLVEPCILVGCPVGGVVLDPFGGSGTVGRVAEDLGRSWLLFDLSPKYAEIAKRKTAQTGLLARCAP